MKKDIRQSTLNKSRQKCADGDVISILRKKKKEDKNLVFLLLSFSRKIDY